MTKFAFPAVLLTLLAPDIYAAAAPQPVGAPVMREIRTAEGAVSHCVVEQAYDNGIRLNVALDAGGRANLGVIVPEAGYSLGDNYAVRLVMPDGFARRLIATAKTPTMILIDLGGDKAFVAQLAEQKQISLIGAMDSMEFSVPTADDAMENLEECAAQNGKSLPPALVALLQAAGLGDAEPVDLDAASKQGDFADFAWRRGDISGGVRQTEPGVKIEFDKAVRAQMAKLKKNCDGKWRQVLQKTERFGTARQQRGVLTCRQKSSNSVMAILFHLSGDGRFTIIAHAGDADQRRIVSAATKNIAKVLASGAAKKQE